jgi:hypothetical protein
VDTEAMMQDQYLGEDGEVSWSLVQDQQRSFNRIVVLKRFSSFTPSAEGTAAGVAPTRNYVYIEASVSFKLVTGKDILLSNGIYSIGDAETTSMLPIISADGRAGSEADKILIDGQDYTLIGKPWPVPMAGGVMQYRAVWRRAS